MTNSPTLIASRKTPAGSMVPRTECRTKAEWADAGLTISRKSSMQLAQR